MFPWPAKHERRAAIDAARAEHRRSQGNAAEAMQVRQQLNRLVLENHYAETIRNSLRRGGQ